MNTLPAWFKQEIPDALTLERAKLLSEAHIHTVCQEAKCPNLSYCFKNLKFTFIILGDTCTRNCRFCGVKKTENKKFLGIDLDEPLRLAKVIKKLGLDYAVITSVARDDLSDGGAKIFAKTIELIRQLNCRIKVEVLIPDFQGKISSLQCILDAKPNIVAHNIETVRRLYKDLRPKARYRLSLGVLRKIKKLNSSITTKSSLMLGVGEIEEEVIHTLEDLRNSGCDILTLGQYLAPSTKAYPVKEFISIKQFQKYQDIGLGLGFKKVLSGPRVRSSYQAEELYGELQYA